uniref:DUF7722 domain-containing protein n=1 Tax=Kalanchoe fedtschenkoi TaxID=63787 RepID=A0A7N0UN30_KALFE
MGAASWVMQHLWCSTMSGYAKKSSSNNIDGSFLTKSSGFQMPLHYPRFNKSDYEKMDEVRLRLLLAEYGLRFDDWGLDEVRAYAIGAFLWPDQL